MIQDFIQKIYL